MSEVLQRLPKAERLSIPIAGRTLLARNRNWAEPILIAHQRLEKILQTRLGLDACASAYHSTYSFLNYGYTSKPTGEITIALCSSALILNWILGRATNAIPKESSLHEAEKWYSGYRTDIDLLSKELTEEEQREILAHMRDLEFGALFPDILPYAAEVFETSEEILKAFGASRKTKRAAGIFYTPSDVSDYIVEQSLLFRQIAKADIREYTWLDPACGTGCFLLSVLYRIAEEEKLTSEEALAFISSSLYGIDISPLALQSAAYALILACGQGLQSIPLRESLFRVGKNLIVGDAIRIQKEESLPALLPALALGADFVISNPPYIRKVTEVSPQRNFFGDGNIKGDEAQNIYTHFVYMLDSFTDSISGTGGMVVPLSISYNSRREFNMLRQFMWGKGRWRLAHFDRTPDSLFGDDVKTRNTIIFFTRAEDAEREIDTTDLIRWSSRSRSELFKGITFSRIISDNKSGVIPKVGDNFGQQLLSLITDNNLILLGKSMSRLTGSSITSEKLLRNAGTAYNWLPFEIDSQLNRGAVSEVKTKYRYWHTNSDRDTLAIFALVQSRLAYWLWRVWGDGFHLTDQFIVSLPLSPLSFSKERRTKLEELGNALWDDMRKHKVISFNAGVISTSYCPYVCEELLDEIDGVIIQAYRLPMHTHTHLREFVKRTIVAGRDGEVASNPALRKWMLKEEKNENSVAGH